MALSSILWVALALEIAGGDGTDWTRWGGPSGDFVLADGPALVDAWPASGPKVLWDHELGDGYSAILCSGGRLFTMYREGEVEIVVALEAASGEVIWDYAYDSGRYDDMTKAFGEGPNATPLLVGERLVSIGIAGKVVCLDVDSGAPAWELDLHERFGRQKRREEYGYSGIPLAYEGKVLVLVGGDEHAVIALDPRDGSVAWGSAPGRVSYAPPRLLRIAGRDQLVYFSPTEVIGMDPRDGRQLWSYPVECFTENNLTSVVQCSDQHLWVACQLDGGTRVLAITEQDGKWSSEALWISRTLKQGHWNSIALGDYVYGSLGDATSMFGAVNWRTGETAWKERGIHAAQLVRADGKLVLVSESGEIALARVSPEGLEILCSHAILESVAWTVPTLVGTTLYARDRKRIVAVDLAKDSYE